jgi:3-ketoacyl-CoA synthase
MSGFVHVLSRPEPERSRLISLINWFHVVSVFFPYVAMGLVGLFTLQFSLNVYLNRGSVDLALATVAAASTPEVWLLGWQGAGLTLTLVYLLARVEAPCYLVDFACWEPPASWRVDHGQLLKMMAAQNCFNAQSMEFLAKILATSGTGQATAWPPSIVACLETGKPQDRSVENARAESKQVRERLRENNTQHQHQPCPPHTCSHGAC